MSVDTRTTNFDPRPEPSDLQATKWNDPDSAPSDKPCLVEIKRRVLLEDSTSASQISLYQTFGFYQSNVRHVLEPIQAKVLDDWNQVQAIIKRENDEKAAAEAAKKAEEERQKQPGTGNRGPAGRNEKYEFTAPSGSSIQILTPGVGPGSAGAAGAAAAGAAAPTPPMSLTYLGDISSAISAAKNGISYTPSSVQPTTQALTTELAKDLCARGIELYNSTSPVNPAEPNGFVDTLTALVAINADIQSRVFANPPSVTNAEDKNLVQSLVSDIAARAALANQLMISLQCWLLSSDGAGNIILTDVMHGNTLSHYIGKGIPALQFTIDAAGGNTRTNSFFLLNLFYTPKPSFNAGVVVTYELRNKENAYIAGDTVKALYDYSKWRPQAFVMTKGAGTDGTSLGTGR